MQPFLKILSRATRRVITTPHFWIVCLLFFTMVFLYYGYEYSRSTIIGWLPWFWRVIVFEFRYHVNGIFFYIPFLYTVLIFSWRGGMIVWLLSMIVIFPHVLSFSPNPSFLISNMLYLSIPLIVAILVVMESRWRERFRKSMIERESERQLYMSHVLRAQEYERQRIARELHDDTIQTLLVIANRVQSLSDGSHDKMWSEVKEQVESINGSILSLVEDIRRLSIDLRPNILDNLGLLPALRWLAERANLDSAINTQVIIDENGRRLNPETEVVIFRFVQEALNNIKKHAKASEAVISLEYDASTIVITVQDNGEGFTLPKKLENLANRGKLGIIGMKERTGLLGGTFNITSEPGKGTAVSMRLNT
jgi:signal transduction histidine kinase